MTPVNNSSWKRKHWNREILGTVWNTVKGWFGKSANADQDTTEQLASINVAIAASAAGMTFGWAIIGVVVYDRDADRADLRARDLLRDCLSVGIRACPDYRQSWRGQVHRHPRDAETDSGARAGGHNHRSRERIRAGVLLRGARPLGTQPARLPLSQVVAVVRLRDDSFSVDAAAMAASLIRGRPETENVHFFQDSMHTVAEAILNVAGDNPDPDNLLKLVSLPRDRLHEALNGTPAYALIDPQAHDKGAGIFGPAADEIKTFVHLPKLNETNPVWSAREWSQQRRGWIFLPRARTSARPSASFRAYGWTAWCAG
jgi:hypothetical protein